MFLCNYCNGVKFLRTFSISELAYQLKIKKYRKRVGTYDERNIKIALLNKNTTNVNKCE